jgi:hypothetical protein
LGPPKPLLAIPCARAGGLINSLQTLILPMRALPLYDFPWIVTWRSRPRERSSFGF